MKTSKLILVAFVVLLMTAFTVMSASAATAPKAKMASIEKVIAHSVEGMSTNKVQCNGEMMFHTAIEINKTGYAVTVPWTVKKEGMFTSPNARRNNLC